MYKTFLTPHMGPETTIKLMICNVQFDKKGYENAFGN
jgi:hypothetical protein